MPVCKDPFKFSHYLRRNVRVTKNEHIFIIARLGTVAKIIGTNHNNAAINQDYLMMHIPGVTIQAHIQSCLAKAVIIRANIQLHLRLFHHTCHNHTVLGALQDSFASLSEVKENAMKYRLSLAD